MFSSSSPKSRFELATELHDLFPLLDLLRAKQKEVAADSSGYAGNPAYKKNLVLTKMLTEIDIFLTEFNKFPKQEPRIKELQCLFYLVKAFKEIIITNAQSHYDVLNENRNTRKEKVNSALGAASWVATIGTGIMSGLTAAGIMFFAAPAAANKIKDALGSSDERARSVAILESLANKLQLIEQDLLFAIQGIDKDVAESIILEKDFDEKNNNQSSVIIEVITNEQANPDTNHLSLTRRY